MAQSELEDVKRRVLARNPRWKWYEPGNAECYSSKFDDGIRVKLKKYPHSYYIEICDESTNSNDSVYENLAEEGSHDYYELKAWFEDAKSDVARKKAQRKEAAKRKFFG